MYGFADLGDAFVIHDRDGEEINSGLVINVEAGSSTVVHTDPEGNNGLQKGSKVKFLNLVGLTALNSATEASDEGPLFDVLDATATTFTVDVDTSAFEPYVRGGYFYEVKQDETVQYKPLAAFLGQAGADGVADLEAVFNTTNFERPAQLHALVQALWASRPQTAWGSDEPFPAPEAIVQAAIASYLPSGAEVSDADRKQLVQAAATAHGDLVATASILGGALAQEVIKAASGRYTPLQQFLYTDLTNALPAELASDRAPTGSRYDGQIAVFGAAVQQKLADSKVFLVGSGALGCEFLKCFAAMGVATSPGAEVVVTDMDTIEKSNLNRQFLFRPRHVGQAKSEVAASAALAINGDMHVRALTMKVAPETEGTFTAEFWRGLSMVIPALDNVHARKYVDSKCIEHKLAMLESGTQGTKCHTMACLPGKSVNYGSVQDPPEKGIPVCTLKSFPTLVEHTLQWARDEFEASFHNAPAEANQYLSSDSYFEEVSAQRNEKVVRLRDAHNALVADLPCTFEDSVKWARVRFERIFSHNVRDLLHQHPLDKTDEDGNSFWSAKKRPPAPAVFDWTNPLHRAFLVAGANLHAGLYGIPAVNDDAAGEAVFLAALEKAQSSVPAWTPSGQKIAATEEEAKALAKAEEDAQDLDAEAERLHSTLPPRESFKTAGGLSLLGVEEFEKDDDSNRHMDFIHAAGIIRAVQYGIPEKSRLESKKIVGRIIPAIATTTAMTVGFVAGEVYKVLLGAELEKFTEWNVNLAVNSFASFEPNPCPVLDVKGTKYTLWDTLDIYKADDADELTFGDIYTFFRGMGLRLMSVSTGALSLWSDDLDAPVESLDMDDEDEAEEAEEFMETLEEGVLEVLNSDGDESLHVAADAPYILVQIEAWDMEGDMDADEPPKVDLPTVRLMLQ